MWGALLEIAGTVLGDVLGGFSEDEQKYLLERTMEEFGRLDAPSLERVIAQELGPSAMEGVRADPELAGIERNALDEMLRIGRSGGMTLEDKANLNTIQGDIARQERAGRNNIREDMARRGLRRGGGAELSMQLANQQGAANRASDAGLNVAAQAQRRALDSILQGGRMASGMRGQDFQEKAQRASAADARTRYNADARQRAAQYNAGLGQQDFNNRVDILQGKAGRSDKLGDFYGQQGAARRALGRGLGKAAGGFIDALDSDGGGYSYSAPPLVNAPDIDEWENPYK